MLRGLEIRDLLIIDHLELNFQPGLNVLTGETGAGKSILLDALGFVLGWRGHSDLVRQGANQGEVTAWFDLAPDHPAVALLEASDLPVGDELILRRVNRADGRKTAYVNDRRCSGEVLRRLSETLVELHGQHDDRGLLSPRTHRALLDQFADLEALRADVRRLWRDLGQATQAVAAAQDALDKLVEEEAYLRHALAELEDLAPEKGEDAALDTARRRMQASERISQDVTRAQSLLGSEGAESALAEAIRWLEGAAAKADGQLDAALTALGRVLVELDEAQNGVARAVEDMSFDPGALEATEERLFAIRALARKHQIDPEDLPDLAETLRRKLDSLDRQGRDLVDLEAAVRAAQTAYDAAATLLSNARRDAASKLDAAVMAELAPLKLERAQFITQISATDPGPDGCESVAFEVATNPGAPSGSLSRVASGGELSRFLLALKVCLRGQNSGVTAIFDEIDRGVGGATADAVGRRLAALAEGGQVLVVTHSPQVAALGAHHWRVEKQVKNGTTTSQVIPLPATQRVDEIARMLAGDTITEEARGAAKALLEG